ncbi:MAG: FHA domain-containing protein [Prevotellaceae bacterium]|jgi:pSer/pThr/pTyr-binding forkhead associated (FHA) protein|nr:FHA domain-containing protein [Prevotellaceae bacterium]
MKVLTISRSPNNDIVFNLSQVSRHHAQLVQHDNGTITISDIGSKNGTYVNRQRIDKDCNIKQWISNW